MKADVSILKVGFSRKVLNTLRSMTGLQESLFFVPERDSCKSLENVGLVPFPQPVFSEVPEWSLECSDAEIPILWGRGKVEAFFRTRKLGLLKLEREPMRPR